MTQSKPWVFSTWKERKHL